MRKLILIISIDVVEQIIVNAQTKVTNFHLRNTEGKIISPDDFKSNKGIILTFTTNDFPV